MKLTVTLCLFCILLGWKCTMHVPFPARSGHFKIGKDSIYFETGGKSGGEDHLILVHAGFLDTDMWRDQVNAFARQYRITAIDLPGHGRSGNDTTRLRPADFIKVVMDSLEISRASLIGVSLGAACVTDFVLAHPDKVNKVVLVSSGLNGWDKKFKFDTLVTGYFSSLFGALGNRDTVKAAEIFTRVWFDGPYRTPAQVNDSARSYIYETTLGNMRKHHVRGWPIFDEPPAIDRISSIQRPVLIIYGDKDMPLITEIGIYLEKNIKGAKRVLMPGTGHMLNMEDPETFNKIVLDFLE